jgi:MFS family permease
MTAISVDQGDLDSEGAVYRKVTLRLLPIIGLCYLVAYLDRVNIGFAKLQMAADLNLSDAAYGLGAGIFFIGYFLFELPSNLIMHRVGARLWMARIMFTWGVIAGLTAFIAEIGTSTGLSNANVFYAMRFLLGLAEAGFFPGIILYFNYWYPSHRQGRVMALLLIAQPVSFIVGGPLSGWIMDSFSNRLGLGGWQWMLLLEAVPALVLSAVLVLYLDNGIDKAAWLTYPEKQRLIENLKLENRDKADVSLAQLARIGMLWAFVIIYFLLVVGIYGINFWLPSIIKATGMRTNLGVGFVTAIPYAISTVVMVIATRHAERTNEKRWHTALAAVLAGSGLMISAAYPGGLWLTLGAMTIAIAGSLTASALFWSFPGSMLKGASVAAGVATINSLGGLGGFAGPSILGWFTQRLGSSSAGLATMGGMMIAAGAVVAITCRQYGLRDSAKPLLAASVNR